MTKEIRNSKSEIFTCPSLMLRMQRLLGVLVRRRLVERLEVRLGAGGDDVGAGRFAVKDMVVVDDLDNHLALGFLPDREAPHLVILQAGGDMRDPFEGVEDRIDPTHPRRRTAEEWLPILLQLDWRRGNRSGSRRSVQRGQLPAVGDFGAAVFDEGRNVGVVYVFLLVAQGDEVVEDLLEHRLVKLVSQVLDAVAKRVPAAVLAANKIASREPHVF